MHIIMGRRINYDRFNISSSDKINFIYTVHEKFSLNICSGSLVPGNRKGHLR